MLKKIIYFLVFGTFLISQTDKQIQQAKDYIKKSGMTESQVKKIAKSRGYTDDQINAAIKKSKSMDGVKIEANDVEQINGTTKDNPFLKENNSISQNTDGEMQFEGNEELEIYNDDLDLKKSELLNLEKKDLFLNEEAKYFGYEIFQQDPALFQATSVGAVDPAYVIGPSDEIIVMLWGETQFRQVLTVDREGFIFIPEIGQLFVNGLNLNLLESKLFKVLSQSYASLNPQSRKATTFLDVSLGNLRPLRIQVVGEVAQPGAYTVSPSATLFSALYYFNGPTFLGSLRDIRLIRNGKKVTSIDFYEYLIKGFKTKDQKLQLDDVIYIPKRKKTVTIVGEINRPAIYELSSEESLNDLVQIAGGLKITAYLDRAQIDRIVPFNLRSEIGMDRMFKDINLSEVINSSKIVDINDGDKIEIFSILDMRQNVAEIHGSVQRPGQYDIGDSLRVSELVIKANNLLGDAYLDRADITRIKKDFTQELIKINLAEAMAGNLDHDKKLQGLDKIHIYSSSEMVETKYVSITGHVQKPGTYILQDSMVVYDLLFKAGGFLDKNFFKKTYPDRADLVRVDSTGMKKEIIPFNLKEVLDSKGESFIKKLKNDDLIRIYSLKEIEGDLKYVTISGHVKKPGKYELYEQNMSLEDLIFKAGGLEDPLHKMNTYLDRADLIRYDKSSFEKIIIPVNLKDIIGSKNQHEKIYLQPEDHLRIYSKQVFNKIRSVEIGGLISMPGKYQYKEGMKLVDLILEAGGFSEDFYYYRIDIARVDSKSSDENIFAKSFSVTLNYDFSYSDVEEENDYFDIDGSVILKPYDYISIRPDPFFSFQKQISIQGSVYYPGEYVILSADETLYDIIERAGGIRPNAFIDGSKFIRNNKELRLNMKKILKNKKSKENIIVQGGDKLFIAEKQNMIQVSGEVNSPGFYKFNSGARVQDVIKNAGGYSTNAELDNVYITFPNGISKKYSRWLSNPKVLDGSIIFVGTKPQEEPFDSTEYFKEITLIFANLAQVISLILLVK